MLFHELVFILIFVVDQGAQLQKHIDATLGSGNLREAVKLPPGEDFNEWLAVNSKSFKLIFTGDSLPLILLIKLYTSLPCLHCSVMRILGSIWKMVTKETAFLLSRRPLIWFEYFPPRVLMLIQHNIGTIALISYYNKVSFVGLNTFFMKNYLPWKPFSKGKHNCRLFIICLFPFMKS